MRNTTLLFTGAVCLLAMFWQTVGLAAGQEVITLDQYLSRVETADPELRGLDLSLKAMGEKILELDMVYSPFLNGTATYLDDKSGPGFGSTLLTDETKGYEWTAGISEKFPTGTSLSAGYSYMGVNMDLLAPYNFGPGYGALKNFDGYQLKPYVRLDQSLLRDFWYGLTQVGIDKAKAAVVAGKYLQVFKRQQIMLNAQLTYWNLVLAQEVVAFRKISLERTEKLLHWNENRVGLDLADAADLFQAQAGFKSRQLNLQMAQEDEVKARRSFQEMLGNTAAAVSVDLEKLVDKVNKYSDVPVLPHSGNRADVLAARASYRNAELADRETYFRSLPELSLSAMYSLNGLALTYAAAADQVNQGQQPTTTVTLSAIIPLDYWTLNKVQDGYHKEYAAAQAQLEKAELDSSTQWTELEQNWTDVKSRLALAQEIKGIQEKRLAHEQKRFQSGRSTTFNVLTAENDLDDATLNVYRTVFEELVTAAQAELFNTQPFKD
jgi:outer membrane protein TolC